VSLTVGILGYMSEKTLPDLLDSIPAALAGVADWHLVIVDGASPDATVEVARRLAPAATIVELGANRGFAAAANAVIESDPAAEAVLLLSPTVRLRPGCVKVMLDALDQPGVGIAVPRLFRGNGRPHQALLGGTATRRFAPLSELIADPAGYTSQTRADWATGAVTLVSRECLKQVGPWDETFFLYSEETDYELRAADAGFRLAFADVNVVHLGGESRVRPELWALLRANRVRLYAMRHSPAPATVFWAVILLGDILRALPRRTPIHRAAIEKLLRERQALVAGQPARVP